MPETASLKRWLQNKDCFPLCNEEKILIRVRASPENRLIHLYTMDQAFLSAEANWKYFGFYDEKDEILYLTNYVTNGFLQEGEEIETKKISSLEAECLKKLNARLNALIEDKENELLEDSFQSSESKIEYDDFLKSAAFDSLVCKALLDKKQILPYELYKVPGFFSGVCQYLNDPQVYVERMASHLLLKDHDSILFHLLSWRKAKETAASLQDLSVNLQAKLKIVERLETCKGKKVNVTLRIGYEDFSCSLDKNMLLSSDDLYICPSLLPKKLQEEIEQRLGAQMLDAYALIPYCNIRQILAGKTVLYQA